MDISFFDSIDYLKSGSPEQRNAYHILQESNIMGILYAFDPLLTGTFPLGINVENSDLDIICHVKDKNDFLELIIRNFGKNDHFNISESSNATNGAIVISFIYKGMEFEIFGQDKPVKEQNAYRHMVNEYKLLNIHGKDFKEKIIVLKQKGMKTEPAFALLLGLKGDPYKSMLIEGNNL